MEPNWRPLQSAILQRIADDPQAGIRVPGYKATFADVAAFMVSAEACAMRAGRKRNAAKIANLASEARKIIAALAHLTRGASCFNLRAYGQDPVWARRSIHDDLVGSGGAGGYLSRVAPGVFDIQPSVYPDLGPVNKHLRTRLLDHGAEAETAVRSRIRTDDGIKLIVDIPAPINDPRIDLQDVIYRGVHTAWAALKSKIDRHAEPAIIRDLHLERAIREVDRCEGLVREVIAGTDGMMVGSVRLYNATAGSDHFLVPNWQTKDPVFIFHVQVKTIDDMLLPADYRVIVRSDDDFLERAAEIRKLVTAHKAKLRAIENQGGNIKYEAVGLAILKAAGVHLERIEKDLRSSPERAVADKCWVRVKNGRVQVRAPLGGGAIWKYDRLEISGTTVPQGVLVGLPGQKMDRVVSHPALEGAVIARATATQKGFVLTAEKRWRSR